MGPAHNRRLETQGEYEESPSFAQGTKIGPLLSVLSDEVNT